MNRADAWLRERSSDRLMVRQLEIETTRRGQVSNPTAPLHSPDRYDYRLPPLEQVVPYLAPVLGPEAASGVLSLVAATEFGGKAFGLELLRLLVASARVESDVLAVPSWIGCRHTPADDAIQLVQPQHPYFDFSPDDPEFSLQGIFQDLAATGRHVNVHDLLGKPVRLVARSSMPREDWRDPAAGTAETVFFSLSRARNGNTAPDQNADLIECLSAGPVVFQALQDGPGLVIDFVWSELLGKRVARIAHGRYLAGKDVVLYLPGNEHLSSYYTHATNDSFASHGVYDLDAAEWVFPMSEADLMCLPLNPQHIAQIERIVQALGEVVKPLPFGVQVEATYLPGKPCQVIQLRPSPMNVRGGSILKDLRLEHKLVHESPAVSRAAYDVLQVYRAYGLDERDRRATLDAERPYSGRAVVILGDSKGFNFCRELVDLAEKGASVVIGPNMMSGWMHGLQRPIGSDGSSYDWATMKPILADLTMVCIPTDDYRYAAKFPEGADILVVSDGVIGRVYQL